MGTHGGLQGIGVDLTGILGGGRMAGLTIKVLL